MVLRNSLVGKVLWRCRSHVLSQPSAEGGASAARARAFRAKALREGGEISVAGLFRTGSGIGQSARACADALEATGLTVRRVDLSAAFGQIDLPADPRLTDCPAPGGTLIVHLNGPEIDRALFLLKNWRGASRRVVGMWVWELPVTPFSWQPATRWLSEIWVPSQYALDAIRPLTGKPVRIVPYFLSPDPLEAQPRPPGDTFTVLAFGDGKSSFERKNLIAAVRAFQQASLPASARLVIKTRNLDSSPVVAAALSAARARDARIEIMDASVARPEIMALIDQCDVLLSLHRCEGFGLTIAEAMLRQKPVVATAWSGNTDFMDETCSVPVPYRLVPVDDSCGVYGRVEGAMWADPDVGFAARALEQLAADPALRRKLGEAARARISPLTTGEAYREALRAGQQ